jgi:hypothetical protein
MSMVKIVIGLSILIVFFLFESLVGLKKIKKLKTIFIDENISISNMNIEGFKKIGYLQKTPDFQIREKDKKDFTIL